MEKPFRFACGPDNRRTIDDWVELAELREATGVSNVTILSPQMEQLAPVVARLAG